jgi:hypothetical protein
MSNLQNFLESDRFIVLGGHKCGTSSLHAYLAQHPDITMPTTKGEDLLNKVNLNLENYANSYDLANPKTIFGEVSSVYLCREKVIPRIKKFFPHAKLIAVLRNPVDRAYSNYNAGKNKDSFLKNLSFDEICLHPHQYLDQDIIKNGLYSQYLEQYLEVFGSEQLLILLFNDFVNNKQAFYQSLFQFVGVDPNFIPDTSFIVRKGGTEKESPLKKLLLNPSVKKTLGKLLKPFTSPEQRRALSYQVSNRFTEKYQPLSPDSKQKLLEFYREDILKTEALIQKDLSVWLQTS